MYQNNKEKCKYQFSASEKLNLKVILKSKSDNISVIRYQPDLTAKSKLEPQKQINQINQVLKQIVLHKA